MAVATDDRRSAGRRGSAPSPTAGWLPCTAASPACPAVGTDHRAGDPRRGAGDRTRVRWHRTARRPASGASPPGRRPDRGDRRRSQPQPRHRRRRRAPTARPQGPRAGAALDDPRPRTSSACCATSAPSIGPPCRRPSVTCCRPGSPRRRPCARRSTATPGAAATACRRSEALEEWLIEGRPADSVLELAMRRLFETYGLPPFEFHAIVAGFEVDFRIVGTPIVLGVRRLGVPRQVPGPAVPGRRARRHLAAAGFVLVRFTYHQIVRRPAEQARRIAAHRWAIARPRTGRETVAELRLIAPRRAIATIRAQMSGARPGQVGVVGVDADVAVGEVAAPHRAVGVAGAEDDVDPDLVAAQVVGQLGELGVVDASSGTPRGRRSGSRPAPGRCRCRRGTCRSPSPPGPSSGRRRAPRS